MPAAPRPLWCATPRTCLLYTSLSDEDFVKTLYRLFMDREGEATGVAFWTEYLQDGHSREEVFYGFADSIEFARIKANYGIQ